MQRVLCAALHVLAAVLGEDLLGQHALQRAELEMNLDGAGIERGERSQRRQPEDPPHVYAPGPHRPGSRNSANSVSAGLAEAWVTRRRRREAVAGCSSRIKRRGPMLVAAASGRQSPS